MVEGFLFSLRAEGKSNGTIEYYTYLLHPLFSYASEQGWPDSVLSLDTRRLREFLTWTATRTFELKVANNGRRIADIPKRAGIYTYFFVHGTKFLRNGGRVQSGIEPKSFELPYVDLALLW